MDKFMPKTIEQLNAEFEARMEKAKQDELNAAAEKADGRDKSRRRSTKSRGSPRSSQSKGSS